MGNLGTIGRSGEHLLSLINDVLEFSKIEAGRTVVNEESFDLGYLLLGLEEMFRLRTRQKGIALTFERADEVPRHIRTDQNKLRQILINLLGNAVKFTDQGEIWLTVRTLPPTADAPGGLPGLCFEVRDTGVGIPEEEQVQIFDAFFQGAARRISGTGTGLGLPISRRFAGLLGGSLEVEPRLSHPHSR